jgi:pectin methylesterase-like acyl-CoA thioesterase
MSLKTNIHKYTRIYDAVVGDATQVASGLATHSTIQAAHDAVTSGASILVLRNSGTQGNLNCTKAISLIGLGWGSILLQVVFQSSAGACLFKGFRLNGSITFASGSIGNTFVEFFRNGQTITDNNATSGLNLILGVD